MYKNICIFCGANEGHLTTAVEKIRKLVHILVNQNHRVIYGGSSKGLMGIVANTALEVGGEVYGIIPKLLVELETAHHGITKLEIVSDMHARKYRMANLADGFIILPGGLGTLEELFEVWTWKLLGYHKKVIAILDVEGYYQKLLSFLKNSAKYGFIKQEYIDELIIEQEPILLMKKFNSYKPNNKNRWETNG